MDSSGARVATPRLDHFQRLADAQEHLIHVNAILQVSPRILDWFEASDALSASLRALDSYISTLLDIKQADEDIRNAELNNEGNQ